MTIMYIAIIDGAGDIAEGYSLATSPRYLVCHQRNKDDNLQRTKARIDDQRADHHSRHVNEE